MGLTVEDIDFAKRRLDSFDIILDVGRMDESLWATCQALGINCPPVLRHPNADSVHCVTPEDVRKLAGDALYGKWMKRNQPEIQVYEYAQRLAADLIKQHPMPKREQRRRERASIDS